jgi:hypothetical protein
MPIHQRLAEGVGGYLDPRCAVGYETCRAAVVFIILSVMRNVYPSLARGA